MGDPPANHGAGLERQLLASLRFRFDHVLDGAPAGFDRFEAGAGTRTPAELVRHLTGLVRKARASVEGASVEPPEATPWTEEVARFRRELSRLDRAFARRPPRWSEAVAGAWRGPLMDAFTHVGQVALLRRLAGVPVAPVAYGRVAMPFAADEADGA